MLSQQPQAGSYGDTTAHMAAPTTMAQLQQRRQLRHSCSEPARASDDYAVHMQQAERAGSPAGSSSSGSALQRSVFGVPQQSPAMLELMALQAIDGELWQLVQVRIARGGRGLSLPSLANAACTNLVVNLGFLVHWRQGLSTARVA
jgi:hypothetical protein